MQKELKDLEAEMNQRIYLLFLAKFENNKSAFARAAYVRESTIRRIFNNEQSITVPILLRLANALEVETTELLKGINFTDKNSK